MKEEFEKRGLSYSESDRSIITVEFAEIDASTTLYAEKKKSSKVSSLPSVIYPVFRAMTGDKVTRNKTFYSREELIGEASKGTGLISWVYPYEVPVINQHLISPGMFTSASEPFGRIKGARYEEGVNGGRGYLCLVPKITDPEAIEKVLDGRYKTLSIGINASEATCSVCNRKLISEGLCDHYKGEVYKIRDAKGDVIEKECYYMLSGLKAREISFVNEPSDTEAKVISTNLGEDGFKNWSKRSGTVVSNESLNKELSINKVLEGFMTSESYKEYTMNIDNNENLSGFENPLPELNTLEQILEAVSNLLNDVTEGKEVSEELNSHIQNAVAKAGLSENHAFRLVLNENSGLPLVEKDKFEQLMASLFKNEENKPEWAEKEADSQKSISLDEMSELFSKLVSALEVSNASVENLTTSLTERETEVSELKTQLDTLASTSEAVLTEKVSSLESQLADSKSKLHSMLATNVATEMFRSQSPLAKGKSFEELVSLLEKRTDESLQDTYSDLLESIAASNEAPVVSKVENPLRTPVKDTLSPDNVVESLAKIQKILKTNSRVITETNEFGKKETVLEPVVEDPEPIQFNIKEDGTVEATLAKHILEV